MKNDTAAGAIDYDMFQPTNLAGGNQMPNQDIQATMGVGGGAPASQVVWPS